MVPNKEKMQINLPKKPLVLTDKRTEIELIEAQRKYDLAQVRLKPSKDKKDNIGQAEGSSKIAKSASDFVEKQNTFLNFIKDALDGIGD